MITIAYVDPGLGLLAWQALIASVLGALFYIKKTRDWLMRLFRKLFRIQRHANDPAALRPPGPELRQ